jgi:glucokinase
MKIYAAVDVGGHNIRCWIADGSGTVLKEGTASTARDASSAEENLDTVAELVLGLAKSLSGSELSCVSIGIPGVVDTDTGVVILVPNVPHWSGLNLREILQERFGTPVLLDNDVNLAAQGEYWQGAAKDCRNFFFIALGTGIGGGVFVDGKPYRGSHFSAGEIGYLALAPGHPEKRIGDLGWFESVASGLAVDLAGTSTAEANPSSYLGRLSAEGQAIKSIHVFDAARKGDPLAEKILDEVSEYIGLAVVNVTALLDPELIVFGGGMGKQGDFLLSRVRAGAERYGLPVPSLRVSKLGEQSQLFGALHAALISKL